MLTEVKVEVFTGLLYAVNERSEVYGTRRRAAVIAFILDIQSDYFSQKN